VLEYLFYCCCNLVIINEMGVCRKPKSEMTPEELAKKEEEEFTTGPMSILTQSVKNNTQVRSVCNNQFISISF